MVNRNSDGQHFFAVLERCQKNRTVALNWSGSPLQIIRHAARGIRKTSHDYRFFPIAREHGLEAALFAASHCYGWYHCGIMCCGDCLTCGK